MKIIKIRDGKPLKGHLTLARSILRNGGVVLYPTDTLYGLGVDIFNEKAIIQLYKLKKRPFDKPVSICLHDIDWIPKIAYINPEIKKIVDEILPGPFTIILKKRDIVSPILTGGSEKVGIRIPDNPLARELSRDFPITTTSANISGMKTYNNIKDILTQIHKVDLIFDAGPLKNGKPSTVIDLTKKPPKILRKGIMASKIKKILRI